MTQKLFKTWVSFKNFKQAVKRGLAALKHRYLITCGPPTKKLMAIKMTRVHKSKKSKQALGKTIPIITIRFYNFVQTLIINFLRRITKHKSFYNEY